jgi:hypothetical protein
MPEHLYIGGEYYYGFLRRLPEIPAQEVWVFQPRRGFGLPKLIWGLRQQGDPVVLPPRAPWLKYFAMSIYKFRRDAQWNTTIHLFYESVLPIDIVASVKIVLYDPISYMDRVDIVAEFDNQAFDGALMSAIQSLFIFDEQRAFSKQVAPFTFNSLTSLPAADFVSAIQEHSIFRQFGVKIRIIIQDCFLPSIYTNIIANARSVLQKELREVERRLREAIRITKDLPYLYAVGSLYYEENYVKIEAILTTMIEEKIGVVDSASDAELLSGIFKDLVGRQIDDLISLSETRDQVVISGEKQVVADDVQPINIRASHIDALYQGTNWQISPPRQKVDEIILINTQDRCRIELQVPGNYPERRPIVKVRQQSSPVSQSEINRVLLPIILPGQYSLLQIVQTIIHEFCPTATP